MERIEKEKEHFIFELEDETGTGQMDVYRVFPGIHLTYNNFRMIQCELELAPPQGTFRIEYCREGKIEWELGYENPSRFAQAFRIYANVSPQVYRTQYRGQK